MCYLFADPDIAVVLVWCRPFQILFSVLPYRFPFLFLFKTVTICKRLFPISLKTKIYYETGAFLSYQSGN